MEDSIAYANDFYEQPWWLNIVSKDTWQEVTVEANGEILGRMPFVVKKTWRGTSIEMPPQTQTLGPWLKPLPREKGNKDIDLQKEIITKLIEQLPSHYSLRLMIDSSISYMLPFYWKGYRIMPRYSYRLRDLDELDKVYENFSKKTKRNINFAMKKVHIDSSTDVDRLYRLLELSYGKQGRKSTSTFEEIKKIVDICESRKSGKMLSAMDDEGNVHACSYFIFDEKICYYFKGGNDYQYRSSCGQNLVLWEGIKFASTVSKEFDFEGSMVEGIENFFRGFGGEMLTYHEIQKLPFYIELFEVLKPKIKKIIGYKI